MERPPMPTPERGAQLEARAAAYMARQSAQEPRHRVEAVQPHPNHSGDEIRAEIAKQLIGGVTAMTPEAERALAWRTVIAERLTDNRVPERYRYEITDWQCPKQRGVFDGCKRYLRGNGAILALVGERGTGKTTIAAQLIIEQCWADWRAIFQEGKPGASWTWTPYRKLSELVSRYKPLYSDFGSRDSEQLTAGRDAFCRAHLVVIDELHECDDLKARDRVLVDLIDRRYSLMTDTLLISNQTVQQFEQSTSDSILSRISEHGGIVPCAWGSWRAGDRKEKARHA